MTPPLAAFVRAELAQPPPPGVAEAVRKLAGLRDTRAALFYGSILRTGDLTGVLDVYLLTDGPHRTGFHGAVERRLWPEVSYHQIEVGGRTLQAKVATMPLDVFARAAAGETLDTTIWTRFVQPCALVWTAEDAAGEEVIQAVCAAAETAAGFAAVLGPAQGTTRDYWAALFRRTYAAEWRMERPGREGQILDHDPARWDALLPLAWAGAGIAFDSEDGRLRPQVAEADRRRRLAAWRVRERMGKPLNAARLLKAAFTFEGAARYAAWKIERHTGVALEVTPWRERHPILAAPGALWTLWRARRRSSV